MIHLKTKKFKNKFEKINQASDVSVHAHVSNQTRHILNKIKFAQKKPIIVNTARGRL